MLGQFPDAPFELLVSIEANVFTLRHANDADLSDGSIGEGSPFHRTFGYYAHGVAVDTAVLPAGWQARLVAVHNSNTGMTPLLLTPRRVFGTSALAAGALLIIAWETVVAPHAAAETPPVTVTVHPAETRPAKDDAELRAWLESMAWHHGYTPSEMRAVLGISEGEIAQALARFGIRADNKPARGDKEPLLVLPYPGGRHPRIGFLEGAVDPQRETKLSIFPPWPDSGYVCLDVPEAIWSNLGLTYLAHTHIPTVWDKQGVKLSRLEWQWRAGGVLGIRRELPNGIGFVVEATPARDHVALRMRLTNGTSAALTDLRVQMCAMLKAARGFEEQTNGNKIFEPPFTACRDGSGKKWIIHAWQPIHRAWGNAPCPCLHADPKFPDCPPGETREVRGWLSFYEGDDVRAEFRRIADVWGK